MYVSMLYACMYVYRHTSIYINIYTLTAAARKVRRLSHRLLPAHRSKYIYIHI